MILYTKEGCKNCENIKKYIKAVKGEKIEIHQLTKEIRTKMIKQGADTMPLLVEKGMLLAQGNGVIEYLITRRNSQI
ncbi:hypothetical protein EII29_02555 [Leptotrichia sp. OH3620_COT-345]|uniref:hypothetical protein n=1 Tax=Leptotrichia sp. OH3620_COT-345 TaxID=2491048 RepID=UPI000F648E45|nr:hypothetical protein [Leptotrichia sp. OH3620_COT-345]RRD40379.1 hypothetical protein EII29_02555 [Leptotrichia sp. OH3620_COT-345]